MKVIKNKEDMDWWGYFLFISLCMSGSLYFFGLYFGVVNKVTDYFFFQFMALGIIFPLSIIVLEYYIHKLVKAKREKKSVFEFEKSMMREHKIAVTLLFLIFLITISFGLFTIWNFNIEPTLNVNSIQEGDIILMDAFSPEENDIEVDTSAIYTNGSYLLDSYLSEKYTSEEYPLSDLAYANFEPYYLEIKSGDIIFFRDLENLTIQSVILNDEEVEENNLLIFGPSEDSYRIQFNKAGTYYLYSLNPYGISLYNPTVKKEVPYILLTIQVTDWKNSERYSLGRAGKEMCTFPVFLNSKYFSC
ncbi:MAG: hypothetical protein Q8R18_01955 [bacterium]|nr:hypothetical protein [bacterium]